MRHQLVVRHIDLLEHRIDVGDKENVHFCHHRRPVAVVGSLFALLVRKDLLLVERVARRSLARGLVAEDRGNDFHRTDAQVVAERIGHVVVFHRRLELLHSLERRSRRSLG
jgi:hypothetical protein